MAISENPRQLDLKDTLIKVGTVSLVALAGLTATSVFAKAEQFRFSGSNVSTPAVPAAPLPPTIAARAGLREIKDQTGLSYPYGDIINRSGRTVEINIDEMVATLNIATAKRLIGKGEPVALVLFSELPNQAEVTEAQDAIRKIAMVSPLLSRENPAIRVYNPNNVRYEFMILENTDGQIASPEVLSRESLQKVIRSSAGEGSTSINQIQVASTVPFLFVR